MKQQGLTNRFLAHISYVSTHHSKQEFPQKVADKALSTFSLSTLRKLYPTEIMSYQKQNLVLVVRDGE